MFTRELQSNIANHIVVARITNITDGYYIQCFNFTNRPTLDFYFYFYTILLLREWEAGRQGDTRELVRKSVLCPPSIESLMWPPVSKLLRGPCYHKLYVVPLTLQGQ